MELFIYGLTIVFWVILDGIKTRQIERLIKINKELRVELGYKNALDTVEEFKADSVTVEKLDDWTVIKGIKVD